MDKKDKPLLKSDEDPMFFKKDELDIEEKSTAGGLHVANPHDSRVNKLGSDSFEDHHQLFKAKTKEEDTQQERNDF